jgi:hypothetical protein
MREAGTLRLCSTVQTGMSTEHQHVSPAALLRENKTLMRQAAYYYMETEPEQKQLAADVLIRATLGQYDRDMIDAFVQRGPGRELDLYDGFFLGSFLDALNHWQLIAGSFDVPYPPARRGDIAENQRRLESATMMAPLGTCGAIGPTGTRGSAPGPPLSTHLPITPLLKRRWAEPPDRQTAGSSRSRAVWLQSIPLASGGLSHRPHVVPV